MRGLTMLMRLFKLDNHQPNRDERIDETHVKLAELEASQEPLKKAVHESGFFLGDAYLIGAENERRASSYHN
jgi:hypothetical protein